MGMLSGRVALITGSGSGVGEATARVFASEGARVAVLDVVAERSAAVSDSINLDGAETFAIAADVASAADMAGAVKTVVERWGRLDILVNNAGIQVLGPFHEQTEEDFDRLIGVNLKGVLFGCRYALPIMLQQKRGVILSTSSVLGLVGDPDLSAYGATKGGIIALTKSLAVAYGPHGIRVNCVCPGDVNTPLVKEFFDFQPEPEAARLAVAKEYPLRRIAEPVEIGNVFAFLASDQASFITGSHVIVDGGLMAEVY
jgi:NAD(P)-dependent dehydrogenase (short-subunit alcohol dehydrogenase family)